MRQQRCETIVELLNSEHEVRVDALAKRFGVSEVSIRKDLMRLEQQGKLVRRFGGAISVKSASQPGTASLAKQAIAKAAAAYVQPGSRILIDSGSTTRALLDCIDHLPDLVIMTNSMATAAAVAAMVNTPTLLMPGGTWDRRSGSFQGRLAEQVLKQYDFDLLFVGADGIDIARGTTTFNEYLGLSRTMAETAKQVVLLAEATKIGRKLPNLELAWADIDLFITDTGIAPDHHQLLMSQGVNVTA